QMIRNIFQTVDSSAFIITGTDQLFVAVSDVFSPIPRQFHRIDVRPFGNWTDTHDLITSPLAESKHLHPNLQTIIELHELCARDPAELQLYCHHMFRAIDGDAVK